MDPLWGMQLEPLLLRGLKSNMWLKAGLRQGFIQSALGNSQGESHGDPVPMLG